MDKESVRYQIANMYPMLHYHDRDIIADTAIMYADSRRFESLFPAFNGYSYRELHSRTLPVHIMSPVFKEALLWIGEYNNFDCTNVTETLREFVPDSTVIIAREGSVALYIDLHPKYLESTTWMDWLARDIMADECSITSEKMLRLWWD